MNERQRLDTKLIGIVLALLALFAGYNTIVNEYFGIVSTDYETLLGPRYFLYSVASAFGLFIFCLVPFIVGVRYQIYKTRQLLEEVGKE